MQGTMCYHLRNVYFDEHEVSTRGVQPSRPMLCKGLLSYGNEGNHCLLLGLWSQL